MGNAEAVPQQKIMSSAKTSDKVLPTDVNATVRHCDTSSQNCTSANNEIETIGGFDETTATEKTTSTNGSDLKPSPSASTTFSNSSPGTGQFQRQMWEEVALRYQQILHREYRMLNLPSYPVEGGNFYLYYVPVIVNPGYVPQNIECNNEAAPSQKTRESNEDVIYIDDSDDDCVSTVKEEPKELAQAVESSHKRNIKVESSKETISCKVQKNKHDDVTSSPKWEKTSISKAFDYRNSFVELKQHTKTDSNERGDASSTNDDDEIIQDKHYDDNNIQVTEDFIRIFKGYTIEYHPLHRDNAVKQRPILPGSQECSERDEKIQDLKRRVAEQKVELEKLKLQQSVEGNESTNGVSQQFTEKQFDGEEIERCRENNKSLFTGQRARGFLRDCPSAQIHYFPSGERKTFLPRRRKQTSPRRIDALSNIKTGRETSDAKIAQTETTISGEVNNSLMKRKRKLTPSPEIVKEKINEDTKRVKCSKKCKVQRKRNKAQHTSKSPIPNLKKGQTWYSEPQKELSCVANSGKATMPQDISQDEFLSVFGLLRMQGETLMV